MSLGTPQYEDFSWFSPLSSMGPYRAADYWQLEESAPYELIRGRFIMSPSPSTLHQIVLFELGGVFRNAQNQADGLAMAAPIDVVFSDDTILQPDLLYIAKDHRHIVKDRIEGAPNLVVEILSPATGRRDKTEKLALYAKYGVPEYWIVDPATQVFEFLLLQDGKYVIEQQPDDRYRSPLLSEVTIDLAAFWAEVERRLPKS